MIRAVAGFLFACFVIVAFAVTPAVSQSEANFVAAFSGKWQVFDKSFGSDGKKCNLSLDEAGADGRYDLTTENCGAELADIAKWGIVDRQLAFMDAGGLVRVRLGGNQRRMTGTTVSNKPVIFDRVGADGLESQLQAIVKNAGCHYLGFTDKCAPASELANPLTVDPDGDKSVQVIVNLNARSEARDDADPIGVVPRDSCVAVETCLTASDGVWCQAAFGERTGWFRKVAIRQNRWPIVTFLNSCPKPSQ